jgi:endonuclease/exonuclease/phosphatase family metal-dependent hydrolase
MGTWNVRTLLKKGKLENIKREMKRMGLGVLGLSEVRWKGCGDFVSDGMRIIYAGGSESQRGVALILDNEIAKRVNKVVQHSDRLLLVKVSAEPVDLVVVQVYMPTSAEDDIEVEKIYEELEELIDKEKGNDYLVVMGDFNAVVGEGRDEQEIGSFGLGKRNERGQALLEFCRRKKFVVTNTWFKHEKRRRYTWIKPGDTGRFQLDYILVRQRFRNSVKNSRSYPGADADSDHNLVMMTSELRLKRMQTSRRRRKWCLEELGQKQAQFQAKMDEAIAKRPTSTDGTVEGDWKAFREVVIQSAEAAIGYQKARRAKKTWISEKMIEKMDERRKWKNSSDERGKKNYKQLNKELERETNKAREEWWKKECEELEELERKGRSELMYSKVKQITRTAKSQAKSNTAINDSRGELLTEVQDIKSRWREYVEDLYCKVDKPKIEELGIEMKEDVEEDSRGPQILESEIRAAIHEMKNGKAVGVDGIPAEFLKMLSDIPMKCLIRICREMYETGKWPEDFTKVVMIPIPKKQNAVDCADHRTISLIAHASKIMLRILTKRIESKAAGVIGKTQFGFRRGCGTRDAIGVMRMLCERSLEFGNDVYICFVDFEKAFDRVNWVKMMDILKKIGVDWRDRRLISSLYMDQTATVRVGDECTDSCTIGRGVRQGCCLSPLLFSLYAEMMMIEAMENIEEGVRVGGQLVKDVRFADDQGMVASTEAGLQRLMDGLVSTAKRYDMKVNVKKTKVMTVSKGGGVVARIVIDGQVVEQVSKFKYLGSLITDDGRSEAEIKARIGMAKDAFTRRKELLTRRMSKVTKKKIIKTVVWSVALYGAETWTLKKDEIRRLNSLEMWLWRRMEKISWTEKKTDEEVLNRVGERRKLVEVVMQRKKNWIGHVLRGEGMMKEVMEGRMEGKRCVGRPRIGMLEELKEGSYANMKRRAEEREGWRCWTPRTCR